MTIIRCSIEEYHAHPAISNTKRRAFVTRGAAYFHGVYVSKTIPPDEPTKALIDGIRFDTLVTDGAEAYYAKYVVKPDGLNLATKAGLAWKAENAGKIVVSADDHTRDMAMLVALNEHPVSSAMLRAPGVETQLTFRISSHTYGVELQSRPDVCSPIPCAWSDGLAWSANIKTVMDLGEWVREDDPEHPHIGAPVHRFGYHHQAALDQYILYQHPEFSKTAHFLIVVEKQQPYRVGIVRLTEEYLELGFDEVDLDLRRMQQCFAAGSWPRSQPSIVELRPPQWLLDQAVRRRAASSDRRDLL